MTVAVKSPAPGSTRPDQLAQALTQGLKIPWLGVRPDLMLKKGAPGMGDKETWILEDPVRGTHYELGESEARFFLCLAAETDLRAAVSRLMATTALRPTVADVLSFVQMLQREKLAVLPPEMAEAMADRREAMKPPLWKKIVFGYLFFKIPLFRPQRFLDAVYPWVSPLWSRPFLFLYGVMGLAGLVFAAQQAELYWNQASRLFTPKGALLFMVCLSVVKTFHEMGHAFAARHHGQFVRRIGIAFMVFMPLFYTDVTDVWKLPSRRGRVFIGAAGILTELAVAAVSLFFWAVLADGPLRSLMFYFSGASIVSTVLVNLNPLMRFDGYYILMDFLRVSNLRTRSNLMFAWFRRKLFVGWRGSKPETHPWEVGMAWFGFFTMIYRIFIFFSITFSIYQFVFKALGAVLVMMQILLMVVLPLTRETLFLLKNRRLWGSPARAAASGLGLAVLVTAFVFPFPGIEKLPGLVVHPGVARLEAPGPGRIEGDLPKIGDPVQEGDLLIRIRDLFLEQERAQVRFDLAQVAAQLETIGAAGAQGGYRRYLQAEAERLRASLAKTEKSLALLEVRAPVSGRVLDVNETLEPGAFVHYEAFLVTVGDDRRAEIHAYADEPAYRLLRADLPEWGRIIFGDLETPPQPGRFKAMRDFPVNDMLNHALFDYAGGEIASLTTPEGNVRPLDPRYPVVFEAPPEAAGKSQGAPCHVLIFSGRLSLADRAGRWLWRTLAAEGFV